MTLTINTTKPSILLVQLLVLCILCSPAVGQQTIKQSEWLTIDDGLSHRQVTDVVMDHQGFLWIATHKGLNKFDGYKLTIYTSNPQSDHYINANDITQIAIDSQQQLLFSYAREDRFIDRLNLRNGQLSQILINGNDELEGTLIHKQFNNAGTYQVLTHQQESYTLYELQANGHFQAILSFEFPFPPPFSFLYTNNQQLWIAHSTKGILLLDSSGTIQLQLPLSTFGITTTFAEPSIFEFARNGELLLAYQEAPGLFIFNPAIQQFQKSSLLPSDKVYDHFLGRSIQ